MDINHVCTGASALVEPDSKEGGRDIIGKGVYATMDDLMGMLQAMNAMIRDAQREFYASMQQTAYQKDMTAIGTKREAIDLNYHAARNKAFAQMFSGALGIGGAAAGGVMRNDLMSSGASGMGKLIEGGASWEAAGLTRQADEQKILGEYQSKAASDLLKVLEAAADKASEASRRMHELTRDLNSLQDRIMSAVKL